MTILSSFDKQIAISVLSLEKLPFIDFTRANVNYGLVNVQLMVDTNKQQLVGVFDGSSLIVEIADKQDLNEVHSQLKTMYE
jgi:hypothetical protein